MKHANSASSRLSTEELASKILGLGPGTPTFPSMKNLVALLRRDRADIEDALAYLVMSGFLKKSYKLGGWSLSSHMANRAKQPKRVQACLFPGSPDSSTDQVALFVAVSRNTEITHGGDPASAVESVKRELETDGWTVKEWRPLVKSNRVIVTLAKQVEVWRQPQDEPKKAEAPAQE